MIDAEKARLMTKKHSNLYYKRIKKDIEGKIKKAAKGSSCKCLYRVNKQERDTIIQWLTDLGYECSVQLTPFDDYRLEISWGIVDEE